MGKGYDPRIVRRTWRYARPFYDRMAWAVLLMVTGAAANLAGPYLTKTAIDDAIGGGDLRLLAWLALAWVFAALVHWLCQFGQVYIMSWVGQNVLFRMRRDLFAHLQRLSFSFYDRQESGRIMSRVTSDVGALQQFLTDGSVAALSDLFVLAGIVTIMLSLNWRLSLLTFTVLPALAIATHVYRARSRELYRETRRKNAIVIGHLAENISGVRVVQAYTREEVNAQQFEHVNRDNLMAMLKAAAFSSGFSPIVALISAIATTLIIWYGGQKVLADELTVGGLYAFIAYVGRFFEPINDLSARYNTMQAAMAGGERVYELLDTPPEIQDRPDASELSPIDGHVVFDRVWFEYVFGRSVLRGLSFEARPGDMIALVGHTGAGKSSIINILLRFYDIKDGAITIDGQNIRNVTTKSLRGQVGLVLQEPFLFSGSIRDNIRYGKLDASDQEIEAAARAVNLHDYIQRLDFGYDAEVGERGVSLSQGQRQLLSFARALVADPRILVLDEATASVDTETEQQIQRALEVLMEGRTSFVIAHRLSTIKAATKIIVLREGEVIEQGTHEELLAQRGYYYDLYTMQFKYQGLGLATNVFGEDGR